MITVEQIHTRLISSGLASKKTIQGCSDKELDQIEQVAGWELPANYREFMSVFGRKAGRFLADVEVFYPDVLETTEVAKEILSWQEIELTLPDYAFVFSQRQGEQFMFFDDPRHPDPPVKYYMEGEEGFETIGSFLGVMEAELEAAEEIYREIRGTIYDKPPYKI